MTATATATVRKTAQTTGSGLPNSKRAAVAEEIGDNATVDLLVQRTQAHEKSAWMLRSTLQT